MEKVLHGEKVSYDPIRTGWTTGIFGCTEDCPGAVDQVCCMPQMFGRMLNALDDKPNTEGDSCAISVAIAVVTLYFGHNVVPMISAYFRFRLVEKYALVRNSSTCDATREILIALCCTSCANCQHARELTNRGSWPGGACFSKEQPQGARMALMR